MAWKELTRLYFKQWAAIINCSQYIRYHRIDRTRSIIRVVISRVIFNELWANYLLKIFHVACCNTTSVINPDERQINHAMSSIFSSLIFSHLDLIKRNNRLPNDCNKYIQNLSSLSLLFLFTNIWNFECFSTKMLIR